MIKVLSLILIITILNGGLIKKIKTDETIIVPGIGAEKIVIGENIATAYKVLNENKYKLSKFRKQKELFKEIFKIESNVKIYYDKIHYFNLKKVIIFSREGIITAIIGLRINRVTEESVSLDRGIDYFIFNYGNENIRQFSNDRGKIYISKKMGIALFDDNDNNKISMFLIFKK